jgi:hypothetical protein
MHRAQHGGDRRHALALSRVELIVLLKLISGTGHRDLGAAQRQPSITALPQR